MIFVIAGREAEAYDYVNRKLEERLRNGETVSKIDDYKYVHSAAVLKGIREPKGVFVGTWKERKDIEEILITLLNSHRAYTPPHATLLRVFEDWERSMTNDQAYSRAAKQLAKDIDNQILKDLINAKNDFILPLPEIR